MEYIKIDIEEYMNMKVKLDNYEVFVNHLKDLNIDEVNEAIEELEEEL